MKRQYEIYIRKDKKKKKLEFQGRGMLIFNCYVVYTNVFKDIWTVQHTFFGKYFFTRHYYFLTSENRTFRLLSETS